MAQIFISYSRGDRVTAQRVYRDLSSQNAHPWMDTEDLLAGQNWEHTIRAAIRSSTVFLALLSKHSIGKRGFVQKELRQALDILDEFPLDGTFVIPARLDECEPLDERLASIQRVDLFPSYDSGFKKLLKSLPRMNSTTH